MPSALTDPDWEIMCIVKKYQPIGKTQIKKHLPHVEAIELRLGDLTSREMHMTKGMRIPIEGTSYLSIENRSISDPLYNEDHQVFRLTRLGDRALQDHLTSKKLARRELWLKSAWIPILVSFATTVITTSLWPTVQRWLLSLLQ